MDDSGFGYTEFSADIVATSTSSVLQFAFSNQPAFWHLDDVCVSSGLPTATPTATATATGSPITGGPLWYNGDFDGGERLLANEQDTSLGAGQFASVYDDFNVTGSGWTVTEVFSNNLENTNVTGATWEIRRGVTLLNTGGTLVAASGTTAAPVVTATGRSGFGFTEFQIKVTGLNVNLPLPPAGETYWLNVTPIGDLDRSFL